MNAEPDTTPNRRVIAAAVVQDGVSAKTDVMPME
jgi:hypothetical protein